jgi:hypothetical protein
MHSKSKSQPLASIISGTGRKVNLITLDKKVASAYEI